MEGSQTIKKDLEIDELDRDMIYDRTLSCCLIHIADSTKWDKDWLLLLLLYCLYSIAL